MSTVSPALKNLFDIIPFDDIIVNEANIIGGLIMSHFFAILSRMKYIKRWGLMRNNREENLSEHTLEVAYIAQALAVISNKRFGGDFDPNAVAAAAMFHDTSEILTGDLPTPIKYYNPDIKSAYKKIEAIAEDELISMLPSDMQDFYREFYTPDEKTEHLIKAADKLSALIKCIEEKNMGNREFSSAEQSAREALASLNLPEANVFMEEFLPSFSMTLDEQRQIKKQ